MYALVLLLVFTASLVGTGMLRQYALERRVLDIPNDRSSHTIPTPRGGGVAIVAAFLLGVVALGGMGLVSVTTAMALVGAGSIVALVGFLDDHRSLPARSRLLAHFAAATWALSWLGGIGPLEIFGRAVDIGWAGDVLAAVALVWLLNLYNFMDGIDGLAGLEALTVCLGAVILCWLHPLAGQEGALPLLLAVATLGFLLWNFPLARIFMGDAGSGFLGLTLGILALRAGGISSSLLWGWLILLGVFVVDATMTLLRRLARRERVSEAHRSHAYQHAMQRLGRHTPVTLGVGAINLFWLFPIALVVGLGVLDGVSGLILAYAPLVWLAAYLGAGVPFADQYGKGASPRA